MTLCSKLRPWFEFEARVSEEGNRFIRAKLLKEILSESKWLKVFNFKNIIKPFTIMKLLALFLTILAEH